MTVSNTIGLHVLGRLGTGATIVANVDTTQFKLKEVCLILRRNNWLWNKHSSSNAAYVGKSHPDTQAFKVCRGDPKEGFGGSDSYCTMVTCFRNPSDLKANHLRTLMWPKALP